MSEYYSDDVEPIHDQGHSGMNNLTDGDGLGGDGILAEDAVDGTEDLPDEVDEALTAGPDEASYEELELLQGPREPADSAHGDRIARGFVPEGNILISAAGNRLNMQYYRGEADPDGAYRPDMVGGIGITRRTFAELDEELPGASRELTNQTGKIVFLGNGLSTAPLETLDGHVSPDDLPEIVALDAVNYQELQANLHRLRAEYEAELVEVPEALADSIAKCDALLRAAADGRIRLVQHIVGEGPMPQEATNADMVVNVYGPSPVHSLNEQIDCLAPGGRLVTSYSGTMTKVLIRSDVSDRVSIAPISQSGEVRGYILARHETPADRVKREIENMPEWRLLREGDIAATPGAAETDFTAEERRTKLALDCALDAYKGDMTRFPNLSAPQKAALHTETQSIGDEEALRVFAYGLLTHDIGKNEAVRQAIGAGQEVDHDAIYARLISDPALAEARREFLPGFETLPAWGQELLVRIAGAELNYPQILQGEAPAAALEGITDVNDPRVIDWDILKAKFDIFGAVGHINSDISLTATEATYRRMQNLDATLRDPSHLTAEQRNNAFLDSELAHFVSTELPDDPKQLAELRALARLECHLRIDNQEAFDELRTNFDAQSAAVKEILAHELSRTTRATLAYYSPELIRVVTGREGGAYGLRYFAHVLQEAHIADIEARKAGLGGISTVQVEGLIRDIRSGQLNTRETAMRFVPRDGALVAETRTPTLQTLEGIPAFADSEMLRGKKVVFVGEGGGSDGIQAAMLGKLMSEKYGCQVAAVVSSRNEERQVANTGWQSGTVKEILPNTRAVGDWRFLEKIPLEGDQPTPMYILNSSDPATISRDLAALVRETGAEVVIGVDTGGDSLFQSAHAGFSARSELDITPDHDYNTISGLSLFASQQSDVRVLSTIVAPGVDSPPYARAVLDQISASQLELTAADVELINRTYNEWRMDGSGSEEGRYGKTPLAWLHALNGRFGLQHLQLPRANVVSDTNPWRAFTTITPAMAGILLTDLRAHFEAIRR